MTTTATSSPLKKGFIFTPIAIAIGLLILTGCIPFEKQPPAIEGIFSEDAQITSFCNIDDIPVDWEKAEAILTKNEAFYREQFGDQWVENIKSAQIQAQDFSKIALCIDAYDFTSDKPLFDILKNTSWILAIDIHGYLPADLVVFGINAQSEKLGIVAKSTDNWDDFERINLYDNISGDFLCSIAIFTSKTTQIRIGQPNRIEQSIVNPAKSMQFADDQLIPENQAWSSLKIPSELLAEITQFEDLLPIDSGALMSGFETVTASFQFTDYVMNSLIALEFSETESADTAFSILNLSNSFVLKPALRKSIGKAKHFIKSIHTERSGDLVLYRSSMNASDAEVIADRLTEGVNSPIIEDALDLIKKN